jgi:hypothetical protein
MTDPQSESRKSWVQKRQDKMAAEIARNRRGEYKVPTWVLAAILLAVLGAWITLIVVS